MTRPTSASTWLKPLLGILLVVALVVAAMQFSGMIFCAMTKAQHLQDVTPYTIYQYWYWYGNHPIWKSYLYTSAGASGLALLTPVGIALAPGRRPKLHGDARWAKASEIRSAGLLGDAGIIVGKRGSRFLVFNGTEQGKNVIVAAPPGSGKTQGLMIPNCLHWPGSLVQLDVKGDCHKRTAGYRRKMGQKVYRLNFLARDYRTHQYNPFAYVSTDRNFRIGDIEKIARYLCPDPPPPGDSFWASNAREMFRGIALYLLDTNQPCTLGTITDVMDTPEELQEFAKRIVKEVQEGKLKLTPEALRDMAKIARRPERTHGGVKDQLGAALAPLKNPLVRFATSDNSFDLRNLRSEPTSIYLTVARPDIPSLRPIINLFFQQLTDLNMLVEFGHDPSHRCEVLLGMDEFAQLGRLDAIFEGVTYFRSFGLRLLCLLQSPAQPRAIYTEAGAETFEQAFDCSVFFTPAARDIKTADLVCRLLGDQTVKAMSESKRKSFDNKNDSTNTSDQKRALMLPQEVLRMPMKKQIVVISGLWPIYADKIKAWKEPILMERNGDAPETPKMVAQSLDNLAAPVTPKSFPEHADGAEVEVVERPIELADMGQLDELTLDDFSCDFSAIDVPTGKLSETEIARLRDSFLETLAEAA